MVTEAEKWEDFREKAGLDPFLISKEGISNSTNRPYNNVIENCVWTPKMPPDNLIKRIPYIKCHEYHLTASHLRNSYNYFIRSTIEGAAAVLGEDTNAGPDTTNEITEAIVGVVGAIGAEASSAADSALISALQSADPAEAYRNLYTGKPGHIYKFPYYSSYHHQIANSWQDKTGFIGKAAEVLGKLAAVGLPSGGVLTIKHWQGTTPAQIPFEFILLNTTERGSENNIKLVRQLISSNLSYRLNKTASLPPSIYSVLIPGVRWSPACSLSNVQIINEGQTHHINGINIPDAFRVMLTFVELIPESRQIYAGVLPGGETQRVSVISADTSQDEARLGGLDASMGSMHA